MTAASRTALEDIARQSCGVMPSCGATQRRSPAPIWSTFRDPIPRGASWIWGAPDGAIYLKRGDPKRVVLDVQSWAGSTPDAKWGPNTQRDVLRRLGLPAEDRSPLTVELMERILLAVYHPQGGIVVLPQAVDLPVPFEVPVHRVTGTAHEVEGIRLATGEVSTPNPATRTNQPSGVAPVEPSVQQAARTAEAASGAPVQPAPTPAGAATPTGVRIQGAPAGVRVWSQPAGGGTAVELTGSPLSAVTGAGLQRLSLESREGARTYEVTVPLGTVLEVSWQLLAAGAPIEKCILACEQGRTDEAARIPGCTCSRALTPAEPPSQGTPLSALAPSAGVPVGWVLAGAAAAALAVALVATRKG